MAYFPMLFSLDNKKILLVGGGYIAYEKLEKLLDFTQDITILAPLVSDEIKKEIPLKSLVYLERKYERGDYKNFDIVIVAVDDFELQKSIYEETRNEKCLCNCVDFAKYCDFIFPSYIKNEDLIVAISTSGSSPAFAKELKLYLKNKIPSSVGSFLKEMKNLRTSMPKGKERMAFFDKKVKEYIESWT